MHGPLFAIAGGLPPQQQQKGAAQFLAWLRLSWWV
jgi:hypothetical protein